MNHSDWSSFDQYLTPSEQELDNQFESLHFTTSGDFSQATYGTSTQATHPTYHIMDYSAPAYRTGSQSTAATSSSRNYSVASSSSYQASQQQRQQSTASSSHSPAPPDQYQGQQQQQQGSPQVNSTEPNLDTLRQLLAQYPKGSDEHTRILSAIYQVQLQLYTTHGRHLIESNSEQVGATVEQYIHHWQHNLAQYQEGTTAWNQLAEACIQWYKNWFATLNSQYSNSVEAGSGDNEQAFSPLALDDATAEAPNIDGTRRSYPCHYPNCPAAPARKADLDRHIHAVHEKNENTVHYCAFPGCPRSREAANAKGFSRKDHLVEHMRKLHGMEQEYPKKQGPKKEKGERSDKKRRN